MFYVIIVGSLLMEDWVVSKSTIDRVSEYGPHIFLMLESRLQIVLKCQDCERLKKKINYGDV